MKSEPKVQRGEQQRKNGRVNYRAHRGVKRIVDIPGISITIPFSNIFGMMDIHAEIAGPAMSLPYGRDIEYTDDGDK